MSLTVRHWFLVEIETAPSVKTRDARVAVYESLTREAAPARALGRLVGVQAYAPASPESA